MYIYVVLSLVSCLPLVASFVPVSHSWQLVEKGGFIRIYRVSLCAPQSTVKTAGLSTQALSVPDTSNIAL